MVKLFWVMVMVTVRIRVRQLRLIQFIYVDGSTVANTSFPGI